MEGNAVLEARVVLRSRRVGLPRCWEGRALCAVVCSESVGAAGEDDSSSDRPLLEERWDLGCWLGLRLVVAEVPATGSTKIEDGTNNDGESDYSRF